MYAPRYVPTEVGAGIAKDAGLDDIVNNLITKDQYDPVTFLLTGDEITRHRSAQDKIQDDDEIQEAIQASYHDLETNEDRRILHSGLLIQPEQDWWRFRYGRTSDTLFPWHAHHNFQRAVPEDRLMVSGLAGMQIARQIKRDNFFTNHNYEKFGFRNYADACAFGGSYIVAKIFALDRERIYGQWPGFTTTRDGMSQTIKFGGTLHGDFVLSGAQAIVSESFAPNGTPIEMSPVIETRVPAYHSVEPHITAALFTHTLLRGGRVAVQELLGECKDVVDSYNHQDDIPDTAIPMFGDYGSGSMTTALGSFNYFLHKPDRIAITDEPQRLHSSIISPMYDGQFEIVSLTDGIRFLNTEPNQPPPEEGITILRSDFAEIFRCLLGQSIKMSGRTSPQQHVEVCNAIVKLLHE